MSINVRGILNKSKRDVLFQWLKFNKFEIICLQETFCTETHRNKVTADWEGLSFHSTSQSPHCKGVSILFNKEFNPQILNVYNDNEGRGIVINCDISGQIISIVNLYAPSEQYQRKQFYSHYKNWIKDKVMNQNCMIFCGDMNCSLENIDRKTQNYDSSRQTFESF